MRGKKATIYYDDKRIIISSGSYQKWEINDGAVIGSRILYGKSGTLQGKVVERWIREKDLDEWIVLKKKKGWSVDNYVKEAG